MGDNCSGWANDAKIGTSIFIWRPGDERSIALKDLNKTL